MIARARLFIWTALFLSLLSMPISSAEANRSGGEADIAACITRASNGLPWLEMTLWGLRDQEAGWIGAEVRNRNGSHDLGPMQVNSQWVNRLASRLDRSPQQVRYWLIHDPCFNVDAARWIFVTGLSASKDFWRAIGIYHSPSTLRQRVYSDSVARKLRKRYGPDVFRARSRDGAR